MRCKNYTKIQDGGGRGPHTVSCQVKFKNEVYKRLLADNKLKFDSFIASICFKTNQKLSELSRLTKLLTFDEKRILFQAFFESQFEYCH